MSTQYSSPGITITERDASLSIQAADTTVVGGVGEFSWGEAFTLLFPNSEKELQATLGKPTPRNAKHYLCATDVLSYTANLSIVRVLDSATAKNATADGTGLLIENRGAFDQLSKSNKTGKKFAAKWAGVLGNSLEVSMADSKTFENWKYKDLFSDKPSTSAYAASLGAKNDELHVVVVDRGGLFTGRPNTVLETFEFLSKARDARTLDLNPNYFENIINEQSKYVWFMSAPTTYDTTVAEEVTAWGSTLLDNTTGAPANFKSLEMPEKGIDGSTAPSPTNPHLAYGGALSGGAIGDEPGDEDFIKGFKLFANSEDSATGIIYMGAIPDSEVINVAQYVIDKIISKREDCILTLSPKFSDVINQSNDDATNNVIKFFNDLNRQSSYVFLTTNWFLQYDPHTDATYWIPDNVGTAGVIARTDHTNDPWFSPAGYTRGVYKNVIRTAWNPSEEDANRFYKYSINRVSNFRGYGTVLFGDRTMITRPSAFRMIGVRRLIIQLKKLIGDASRYTLFEFNDSISRRRFVSIVEPYLLQVQAGRGLDSFSVVCDETNNTGQVINEQRFVADIYIRPLYSINRIYLNFILVNNTISFKEASQG